MAYHIFETEALVLGGVSVGEANRYVLLLTEELGALRAVARSVRRENSKLRYALQKFSLSHVSLVRGKESWRLVGAVPEADYSATFRNAPLKRRISARIISLIERLHGEEVNPYAYQTIKHFYGALGAEENAERTPDIELVTALRLLFALGYMQKDADTEAYLTDADLSSAVLDRAAADREKLLAFVNHALATT
jgi:DNA repair protein RecO (recombination protein O)